MRRYLAYALACVLAAISVSALAMGLGEIRLNSYLNQRLDAEIELVSAAGDELESLEVSLADRQAFQRYGLERDAVLGSLQFRVVRRPNGTAYVKVTSSEPVREPFLTFLIEADWSRGRVLREYTVLLDPPTFASREQSPVPARAEAPAVTPEPARQPQSVEPRAAEEPVLAETQESGDVVNIPSLDEEVEPRRIPGPAVQPGMAESYGPIQRNETLWGIAQRLRPDTSVTINQVMVALYRANPEAFQGNINRLKAGYILRVPSFDDVSSISRREAFLDVKRQNEEWQSGSRPAPAQPAAPAPVVEAEPELSLVAPEEDIDADAGMGVGAEEQRSELGFGGEDAAETAEPVDEFAEPALDLGIEDEPSERLLDVEDDSMQALQSQEALVDGAEAVEPPPLPNETPETTVTEETVAEETAAETAVSSETPAAETAQPEPRMAAPVRRAEPTLIEKLTNLALGPLGMGIVAAILVLFLAGFLVIRKRREAARANAAAALAEWDEDASDESMYAESDDDDATAMADVGEDGNQDSVFAHDMEHEDTGTTRLEDDAEATQLLDADKTKIMQAEPESDEESPSDDSDSSDDFTDTVFGGDAVTLDENDPLSEADFHMAYGLYDQAAEVVQKAVQRDPSRKDYLAKLAEIHFSSNNTDGFLEAAGRLKELAGAGDAEWDNVAIMGRQIAPDNELFAEGGSTASVDLDFGSADEEFAAEPAREPVAEADNAIADDSLDFDLQVDPSVDAESAERQEAPAQEPEGELDLSSFADSGETSAAADEAESTDGLDFDLDLGDLGEGGTESESATAEAESSAENSDFDFDLGDFGSDADAASIEEAGTADASGYDDDNTQTEFDKALEELSAFVDTNVPEEDAGDAVDSTESDAGLSLDEYSFDQDAAEQAADEMDAEGTGEDEEDIGEIGTKLDLARAYIDMGDPDGARSILEEVVSDGDDEQQQEARELLGQLA